MEEKLPYSPHGISSAVDALKLQLPMMQLPERHLIGFSNGVFDLKACQFRPHCKNDWLLLANDVAFNSPASGETLKDHAPQFWQWLNRATANCESKFDRALAALENPRERALIVGYSLIILPDQTRYVGDGSGIKAITGGDEVAIDPKHKQPYSTRIPAVVLAVNNNAMSFSV